MRGLKLIASAALIAAPLFLVDLPPAAAGGDIENGLAGSMKLPVTSMKARPFKSVVMQQYDFSCGAAVVATLLTHHYGRPTPEADVFKAMYENGDQTVIQQEGFSFLDMKNYFAGIGLRADGFELGLDDIEDLGVPAIALVNLNGYYHFVLIKGIKGDRVLVGDPAFGTMAMKRDKFEAIRQPVVLLVRNKASVGKKHFNQVAEWGLKPDAPVNSIMRNSSTMFLDMFGNTW
jgi:predicted double-glycine peptidase